MKGDLSGSKFCNCPPPPRTAVDQMRYSLLTKYKFLIAFDQVTRINEVYHSAGCSHSSLTSGFVRLSWCWCHCPLPEKCFSSIPDKGFSVERADLKRWMWRCSRASALQPWDHQVSCLGHGCVVLRADTVLVHEIADAGACTGLGLGKRVGCQDPTWKTLFPVHSSICRSSWLLSAALHLGRCFALGTMEHLTVALVCAPGAGRRTAPMASTWDAGAAGKARGETSSELCVQSLRRGSSALQPFQKGFSVSLFSSSHVWSSAFVLQLSLVGDSLKFFWRFKKISMLSPLNFQNPTKGF